MVRIMVYTVLAGTAVTVETDHQHPDHHWPTSDHWHSLAYVLGPSLAHDEYEQMLDLIAEAVTLAHPRAAERGGWSLLT